MAPGRYPIPIGGRSALLLRVLFGVTRERAWVSIADGQLKTEGRSPKTEYR